MEQQASPLIPAKQISEMAKNKNTIIIDARSGADAYERYLGGHVEGALHVDLERDLSHKPGDASQGGRHPLPPVKNFAALMGKLGIIPSSDVIVYDDKSGANAAARFWWMIKSAGHEKISVVDGGLDALIKQNVPLTTAVPIPQTAAPYPVEQWKLPTADIDAVDKATSDPDFCIIDVREAYRYRGEREPIDLVAGHIPGAVNVPFIENLDVQGSFLPAEELKKKFQKIIGNREPGNVIVHCGSGVTACHTLLAMAHAGISGTKLYVGSWSEWSRNNKPIEKSV